MTAKLTDHHTSQQMWMMLMALALTCTHAEAARVLQQQIVLLNPGQLQQTTIQQPVMQQTTLQQPAMQQATLQQPATQQTVNQAYSSSQAGQYTGSSTPVMAQSTASTNQYMPSQGNQWTPGSTAVAGQAAPQQWYGQQQFGQQQYSQQLNSPQQSQPASSGSQSAGDLPDPELQTTLDMHNQFRAKHQVGPLSWSTALQASAQQWADQCVFQHSGPGENLAQYFQNFQSVTQAWYDEVKDYHYDGQFSEATGHFTQMVWKASTQLGCGYNTGCQLYVCHYNPSGNVLGTFQENVLQATS